MLSIWCAQQPAGGWDFSVNFPPAASSKGEHAGAVDPQVGAAVATWSDNDRVCADVSRRDDDESWGSFFSFHEENWETVIWNENDIWNTYMGIWIEVKLRFYFISRPSKVSCAKDINKNQINFPSYDPFQFLLCVFHYLPLAVWFNLIHFQYIFTIEYLLFFWGLTWITYAMMARGGNQLYYHDFFFLILPIFFIN